ncbi:MAG TPA: ABC-type transport auxiliary lipoprotein family protein [Blastocatellia bacterium]|nr:ABC-type transport auxiliary lipoprotein family protein [Blastocatellia bacterium]
MNRTITILRNSLVFAVLIFATFACNAPAIHYYAVKVDKHDAATGQPLADASVAVERLSGDKIYNQDRIIYRDSNNEIGFYEYHQWTSPPIDLVTQSLTSNLIYSGYFRSVSSYREAVDPTYILTGRLLNFEEVDKTEGVYASVRLELTLIDRKKQSTVWSGYGESELPVQIKKVNAVAQQLDEALSNSVKQAIQNLGGFVKNNH